MNILNILKILLKRVQILLTLVFIVTLLTIIFLPKINQRMKLAMENKDLQKKIEAIEKEIEELRKKEAAIQSNPHYLEKLARNKLGFSAPDEIIYKFD